MIKQFYPTFLQIVQNMHANISQQNSNQYYSLEQAIFTRITDLDSNNHKLLAFADHISQTSFMKTTKVPIIISQLENEIRYTLEGLIQHIKEYFVDIDMKLRQLCSAVNQVMLENNPQTISNHSQSLRKQNVSILDVLSEKVSELEGSLKKTQQNEQKLVSIIENICEKHHIKKQSPSQIQQKIQPKQPKMKSKAYNTHLFEANQRFKSMKQSEISIYDKLKVYADSSASVPVQQHQKQTDLGLKIRSRQQFVSPNSRQPKKSLKNNYQIKQSTISSNEGSMYRNNHNHRFKFLVEQLNKNS